ncbi:disrupted in renal carcinoma protein 2 [Aphis craccivora]|uniref:Disrupted in renal carcinoma protein 2 n=1 Tax=Aphis craccivora TaxID=307492 RepID=A0A6G0VTL6_APHCR|nr:disrupted in renal carcinoma protein 2 [Aphis craccivora]
MLGCFSISTLSFFWLLMVVGLKTWLPPTVLKYSCYVIVAAISFNWSCQSMFLNMSSEFEYPLAQPLFAGFMTVISNLFQNIVYLVTLEKHYTYDFDRPHLRRIKIRIRAAYLQLVSISDTRQRNNSLKENGENISLNKQFSDKLFTSATYPAKRFGTWIHEFDVHLEEQMLANSKKLRYSKALQHDSLFVDGVRIRKPRTPQVDLGFIIHA